MMVSFDNTTIGTVISLMLLTSFSSSDNHGMIVFNDGSNIPRHNVYKNAAIATEHPKCTQIGVDVMKNLNGTAIDAAIAALLCIGVVNNHSSGIGGGGIMLVRDPNGKYEVIDFRETAPKLSTQDMFVGKPDKSKVGGLAVAVPGEIAGLFYAYRKYKKFRSNGPKWKDLMKPSIDLARNGFQVSRKLHESIKSTKDQIKEYKELSSLYLRDGEPLHAGETMKRINLAKTLELLSEDAEAEIDTEVIHKGTPKSFYQGSIASSIVKSVGEYGGILSLNDLKEYSVKSRVPLISSYRNKYDVVSVGPPGSGSTLIYMLNILQNFDFQSIFNVTEAHRLVEAMKFGYGARMGLGDVDHVAQMNAIVDTMIKPESGEKSARLIDDNKTFHDIKHYTDYVQSMNTQGTTHLSVVDPFGMVVSVTSTVNLIFGSMVMDGKTGIILNDHMDDFSTPGANNFFGIPPGLNNYISPNKRPISSAAPVCVEKDGIPVIVSGASGGSLITSATLFSIINILDFAQSPEAALASPRMHHQLIPDEVVIESTFTPALEEGLKKFGHKLRRLKTAQYRSSVQLISKDYDGLLHAVSDHRKEGTAGGF